MKMSDDIVVLSLPLLAGVGIAAALKLSPFVGAFCMAGAALCMAVMTLRKKRSTLLAALTFLLLGAFTWSAHSAWSPGGTPPEGRNTREITSPALPGRALRGLSAVITRIPFPHKETNALLLALLTGRRELLDAHTVKAFRAAGASHILALSGLHLGIIYLILSKFLFFLGNTRRAWLIRSAVIVFLSGFYTLITGAGPSIVRAFIFITVAEIARNCPGRRKTASGTLCTALIIQLCIKPAVILSIGFQLSYLAMLGIFLLFPALKDWYPSAGKQIERWDPLRRAWEAMALSLSCQVFTAPLVWLRFRIFPKFFLLSNLVSLPLSWCLITGGLLCTALEAAKISPHLLVRAVDWIATLLIDSLEIIALM